MLRVWRTPLITIVNESCTHVIDVNHYQCRRAIVGPWDNNVRLRLLYGRSSFQDPTQALTREQLEVRHLLVSGIVSTDVMISPVSSWLAFCFALAVWFLNCRYTPPGILQCGPCIGMNVQGDRLLTVAAVHRHRGYTLVRWRKAPRSTYLRSWAQTGTCPASRDSACSGGVPDLTR